MNPIPRGSAFAVGISSHLITPTRGNPSSITMRRRGGQTKWIEINNENPELPILNSRRIASYLHTAVSMMDMIRMTLKTPFAQIFPIDSLHHRFMEFALLWPFALSISKRRH